MHDIWYYIIEHSDHKSKAILALTCRDMLEVINAISPLSLSGINWNIAQSSKNITHNYECRNLSLYCIGRTYDIEKYLRKTRRRFGMHVIKYMFFGEYIDSISIYGEKIIHRSTKSNYLPIYIGYKVSDGFEIIKDGDIILIIDGENLIYSYTSTRYKRYIREFHIGKLQDIRECIMMARSKSQL